MRRATRLAATTLLLAAAAPAFAHKPTVTTFTYGRDIYPIFDAKCGSCHRSGGVAPMSLLTYDEAYPWAVSIKNEVLGLSMPPWFADDRYGAFQHGGGLTAEEMDTIVDWCLGGSPEGDAPPATAMDGVAPWTLGPPDRMLAMPEPVLLDADTSEAVVEVVFDAALDEGSRLRAFDIRPVAANILRSATLLVEGVDEPLGTWLPGQPTSAFPVGRGRVVPTEARLVLRLRYKKTWLDDGTPVEDRSTVAIYLDADRGDDPVEALAVDGGSSIAIDADARLIAMLPLVESRVDGLLAELVRADGSREPLLRLHQPTPEWPRKYWLEEPVALPAGSRIELTVESTEGAPVVASVVLDLVSD